MSSLPLMSLKNVPIQVDDSMRQESESASEAEKIKEQVCLEFCNTTELS